MPLWLAFNPIAWQDRLQGLSLPLSCPVLPSLRVVALFPRLTGASSCCKVRLVPVSAQAGSPAGSGYLALGPGWPQCRRDEAIVAWDQGLRIRVERVGRRRALE